MIMLCLLELLFVLLVPPLTDETTSTIITHTIATTTHTIHINVCDICLTTINNTNIATQAKVHMTPDKEAVGLSRVNKYQSKCIRRDNIIVYSVLKHICILLEYTCTLS